MAEVNAKDLTTKTAPASTDSMLLFGTSTNEGAKITVDNLANNILERLATKTFPNQVGGSSAATILAQLATLNSNFTPTLVQPTTKENCTLLFGGYYQIGKIVVVMARVSFTTTASNMYLFDVPAPGGGTISGGSSIVGVSNNSNYKVTILKNGSVYVSGLSGTHTDETLVCSACYISS